MPTARPQSGNSASTVAVAGKAPVFVVGSPRSGTTLLYHMILSSGRFAVYRTETHAFNVVGARYRNLHVRRNRERMIDQWLKSKYFRLTGLDAEETRRHVMDDCRNPGDFVRIIMEDIARAQGVDRWAENTPEHVLYLQEVKRTIPDARIVHIIRDGRDVALSLDKMNWVRRLHWDYRDGLLISALYWEWMVESGLSAAPALAPDYIEVHYEDLICRPRETLARIGQFIQHDLDYDRIVEVGIGSVSEPNSSFAATPGDGQFNPVGRWRKTMSPKQVADCEALIGPCLEKLGYELSTPRPQVSVNWHLKRLRAQYLTFFSFSLWIKSQLPLANRLVDISWLRE